MTLRPGRGSLMTTGMLKRYASERSAICDPVIRRFTSDINRTPKRFRSEPGTDHVRRTVTHMVRRKDRCSYDANDIDRYFGTKNIRCFVTFTDPRLINRQHYGTLPSHLSWRWHAVASGSSLAEYIAYRLHFNSLMSTAHSATGKRPITQTQWSVAYIATQKQEAGNARCVVSVEILPIIATQQCRNHLYDKSWTNRSYEVGGLQWAGVY